MSAAEVRTTLVLPADLAAKVDDYWHAERLNSRPDAIRELLRQALNKHWGDLIDQVAQPAKEQRR